MQALQTSKVTCEPMIDDGRGPNDPTQRRITQGSGNQAGKDSCGDVLVHGLWETGSSCVLDICITDTNVTSHADKTSKKVLETYVKRKKDKYLQACLDRRRSFTPLVYSVDGMACKEARAFEKRIASLLSDKWNRTYSKLVGYVRGRMAMSISRSNTVGLRGARVRRRTVPWVEDDDAYEATRGQTEG